MVASGPFGKNNKKDKKDSSNNYRFEIWLRGVSRAEADEIRNKTLEVVNPGSLGAPCNLLSPRRKLLYGLFAFGPGTLLGMYLYSVKKRMKREDGVMRLDQAVQEIRNRLRRLEEEAIVSRQNAAKVATAVSTKVDKEKTQPLEKM
ncbi:unnamed protein product [Peronospora destructor]|uniref:Transmembrane protein n=1 Tax=Peronospora destructor TaxID=86335 RepID=A0AAV0VBJ2_9STRA|nr:unnamed protein product [Peronospora destructor]